MSSTSNNDDQTSEQRGQGVTSLFDKYHERITNSEISEVGCQIYPRKVSSKGISKDTSTIGIRRDDKTVQCCEGEDDSEFFETLERCQNKHHQSTRTRTHHQLKFQCRSDMQRINLMKFLRKGSSLFESLLVGREQKKIQKKKKRLTIAFGNTKIDKENMNLENLSHCTLMYVTCLHEVSES